MRQRHVPIVALVILTILAPASTGFVGADNPLAVYVTFPKGTYTVGSTMDVDVWVYNASVAYDPFSITFSLGFFGSGREVALSRADVGHYATSFTIEQTDISALFPGILFMNAIVADGAGPDAPNAMAISFITLAALEVTVSTGRDYEVYHPQPGDTVDFSVDFVYQGTPTEPDDGTVAANITDALGAVTPVGLTRTSPGVYTGSYTIPAGLSVGQEFSINARGSLTTGAGTVESSSSAYFSVELFSVWMNVVSASHSGITVDVFGLSRSGETVKGATASVDFEYRDTLGDNVVSPHVVPIDATGKAVISDDLASIAPDVTSVRLSGQVGWAGMVQMLSGDVQVLGQAAVPPPGSGFFVGSASPSLLRLGETTTVSQVAYLDGSVLPSQDVYVYVVGDQEVFFHGKTTTDAQGRFTFDVKAPATVPAQAPIAMLTVEYQSYVGGTWNSTIAALYAGNLSLSDILGAPNAGTAVAVAPFEQGGTVAVTLTDPEATGAEIALVTWGLGDRSHWEDLLAVYAPNWSSWTGGDISYLRMEPCAWSGGAFHASFPFPGFVPTDVPVFVTGTIEIGGSLRSASLDGLHALVPSHVPPTVEIGYPLEGGTYWGAIVANGTSSGTTPVQYVEVRIDGGVWDNATGIAEWTYPVDTTALAFGAHTIEARSFDGVAYSDVDLVNFKVDQLPTVTVSVRAEGGTYDGTLVASGTASDDVGVVNVTVQLDGGPAAVATGTTSWTMAIDTTALSFGAHTLTAVSNSATQSSAPAVVHFTVDQPPTVAITFPVAGVSYNGTITATGTATDDGTLVRVDVRLDGGDWLPATGTGAWSFQIDTTLLGYGTHTLDARAFDGVSYSPVASVSYVVDQPPTVAIAAPTDGSVVSGYINITGTASDDEAIVVVEVRIDGGAWTEATGTASWSFEVDTTLLAFGAHSASARSYDGSSYSPVATIGLSVDQPPTVLSVDVPGHALGGVVTINGTASDDGGVTRVEWKVDNGPWDRATGTTSWSFQLNTTALIYGSHMVYVRAYDGRAYSATASHVFEVDQAPTITVTAPVAGAKYKKAFEMKGTSSDDVNVTMVQYRIDGGQWVSATGTTSWSAKLDVGKLSKGSHTIEFRSFDGQSYSPVTSRTIVVEKAAKSPGMGALAAAVGIVAVAVALARRRR